MQETTLNTLGNSIWDIQLKKAKASIDVQEAEDKLRKTEEYKDLEFKKEVLRQYEQTEEEMKEAIKVWMEQLNLKSLDFINQKVTLKNNPPSVKINDEELIPDKFKKEKISITIDKTAIKKAIQDGEEVIGAELVVGKSLVITPKWNA